MLYSNCYQTALIKVKYFRIYNRINIKLKPKKLKRKGIVAISGTVFDRHIRISIPEARIISAKGLTINYLGDFIINSRLCEEISYNHTKNTNI